jgi:hypothetical protein
MAMAGRLPELQAFINAFRDAIWARTEPGSPAARASSRIFRALENPGMPEPVSPARLPCCRHLEPALNMAEADVRAPAALAGAFRVLEPYLQWTVRSNAAQVGEPFLSGHANVFFIGPGRLESRKDVWMGASLMAPNITYPDHDHAPEEVYVALSPGAWRQNAGPWVEPGIGGLVYNPHGIRHAMRSGAEPLLAAWCLWVGD